VGSRMKPRPQVPGSLLFTCSEVQRSVGVTFLIPGPASLTRSPSLLEEAGQDAEEALMDAPTLTCLSSFILLHTSVCF